MAFNLVAELRAIKRGHDPIEVADGKHGNIGRRDLAAACHQQMRDDLGHGPKSGALHGEFIGSRDAA